MTQAGRAKNRRVEIVVGGKPTQPEHRSSWAQLRVSKNG
jgi:hypothetical protein